MVQTRPAPRLRQGLWFAPPALWAFAAREREQMSRSEVIRVRLTTEEKQVLADLCGTERTKSDVIRHLFRDRAGLPMPVAPIEAVALRAAVEELRRIGINLNQAVRAMNEGRVGYEPQLETALVQLIDGVSGLRADFDDVLRLGRIRRGGQRNGA